VSESPAAAIEVDRDLIQPRGEAASDIHLEGNRADLADDTDFRVTAA
jgi:hypothetical protein